MKRRQGSGVAMVIIALISGLWSGWAMSQAAREEAKPANGEVRYPPYPEVWELKLATEEKALAFFETAAGDIAILHHISRTVNAGGSEKWVMGFHYYFSGGERVLDKEPADASEVLPLGFREPLRLSDGWLVFNGSDGSAHCGNEFGGYVEIKDRQGQSLRKFRIMYLLDEPEYDPGSSCEGDKPRLVHVVSFDSDFIPLQDGTFLATYRHLVVRFRQDFSTGSKWLNERLFIVGMEVDPYRELGWNADRRNGAVATRQEVWVAYLTKLQGEGR